MFSSSSGTAGRGGRGGEPGVMDVAIPAISCGGGRRMTESTSRSGIQLSGGT